MRRNRFPLLAIPALLLAGPYPIPAHAQSAAPATAGTAAVERCGTFTRGSVDPKLDPPVEIRTCIKEEGKRTTVASTVRNLSRSKSYRVTVENNLYWRDSGGDHFKGLKTCAGMQVKPSGSSTCSAYVDGATYPYPRWGLGHIRFPGTDYLTFATDTPMIKKS